MVRSYISLLTMFQANLFIDVYGDDSENLSGVMYAFAVCFSALISVTFLLGMHTYLILSNQVITYIFFYQ